MNEQFVFLTRMGFLKFEVNKCKLFFSYARKWHNEGEVSIQLNKRLTSVRKKKYLTFLRPQNQEKGHFTLTDCDDELHSV